MDVDRNIVSPMGESQKLPISTVDVLDQSTEYPSSQINQLHSDRVINLQETLAENIVLKRELRTKLEQILRLRTELEILIQPRRAETSVTSYDNSEINQRFFYDGMGDTYRSFESSRLVNASMCLQDPSFESSQTVNVTLSQSFVDWVETNRSDVIHKVSTGTVTIRDLTVGSLSGWTCAYVLKKFGATALTAVGGGLLLLHFAHQGGYVIVDWNQIYSRLEQTTAELDGSGDYDNPTDQASTFDWFVERLKKVRNWALENRHFAAGFLGGFIYKTYA